MRIAHVTDPHLVNNDTALFGLDPMERLDAVLRKIETDHADVDLCVISGDLADTADPAAYQLLRARLERFPIATRLMVGNHDDRSVFKTSFPAIPIDPNGFIQTYDDIGDFRLIYLDTLERGAPQGRLCSIRLAWLQEALDGARNRSLVIFTHYPFLPIGLPHFQGMLLENPGDVMPLLKAHGRVRHIFCGHAHVAMTGQWEGIPFSISAGTCHHIIPDLLDHDARFTAMAPQFDIATITSEAVLVHRIEVQERSILAISKGV